MISENVNDVIDNLAASHAKNSQYLKDKLHELHDIMTCSLLKDYDFRQNYINIIFKESMIDELDKQYKYINLIKNKAIYNNIANRKKDKFNELRNILGNFIGNKSSKDFETLLKFKTRSFQNLANTNVIKFEEVIELLDVKSNEINNTRESINIICDVGVEISNNDILLSWLDINKILLDHDENLDLASILLMYYMRIDNIYENIIRRINAHNLRITSNENDYYTYMNRIKKKYEVNRVNIIDRLNRDKKISDDTVSIIDKVLDKKKIPEINLVKSTIHIDYNKDDLEKLNRFDTSRFDTICYNFDIMLNTTENTKIIELIGSSDEESDVE